jgi:gliding motility associated protien GldN
MKHIFNLFILGFIVFFTCDSYAQVNLLNAQDPADIGKRDQMQVKQDEDKKLEYGYVDERDIMFSKVIWEVIDLDQRVNFPYLYPIDTSVVGKERRPLIHYLLKGMKEGKINLIYDDGKFNNKITYDEFVGQESKYGGLFYKKINEEGEDHIELVAGGDNEYIDQFEISLGDNYPSGFYKEIEDTYNGGYFDDLQTWFDDLDYRVNNEKSEDPAILQEFVRLRNKSLISFLEEKYSSKYVTTYNFTYDMIDHYKIKGVWYFDKRIAELKYRPLAIAPVARQTINIESDSKAEDNNETLSTPIAMFWIYYPDARDVLKDSYVFSDSNSVIRKSFDELINARRFHTMIYLEENMYEDREVGDYISDNAFMRLLESERIKEKIRNFEHDMWSW